MKNAKPELEILEDRSLPSQAVIGGLLIILQPSQGAPLTAGATGGAVFASSSAGFAYASPQAVLATQNGAVAVASGGGTALAASSSGVAFAAPGVALTSSASGTAVALTGPSDSGTWELVAVYGNQIGALEVLQGVAGYNTQANQ